MTTYAKSSIKVAEGTGADTKTAKEYILASSHCSVELAALAELRVLFDEQSLQQQGLLNTEQNKRLQALRTGRAGVTVFDYPAAGSQDASSLVLRHYRRGGMIQRISKEKYWWRGLEKTRAFSELLLLDELAQQGLPVCVPFAARVLRKGLFYTASLITFEIPNSQPLSSLLKQQPVSDEVWRAVGGVVRAMHDLQVFHADLNAHNILVQGEKAFLIDFDRGERRVTDDCWKQANVQRLLRSLNKIREKDEALFNDDQWKIFLSAYVKAETA